VSIAFKTVLQMFAKPLLAMLNIYAGAVLGGFYMLWLPLCIMMTGKRGSALFFCLLQALLLFATGLPGSHGIWNFAVYLLPGVAVELVYLYRPRKGYGIWHFLLGVVSANIIGVFLTTGIYIPGITPIFIAVTVLLAVLSGIVGGVVGDYVIRYIGKINILNIKKRKQSAPKYLKDYNVNDEQ